MEEVEEKLESPEAHAELEEPAAAEEETKPSEEFAEPPVPVQAGSEIETQESAELETEPEQLILQAEDAASDYIFIAEAAAEPVANGGEAVRLKAIVEAAIYITEDPLTAEQIAAAIEQPLDRIKEVLAQLVAEYAAPDRGLAVREIAGGYNMATKPEHHESIRRFVKGLQAPFKLSQASLETLAVVAYKQPITAPEIMEIRGVQGAGVLKTLLDRKLVAAAGRKDVLGKPILYKTTREFLIQFGLNSLAELPTLKEFEDLGRLAFSEEEPTPAEPVAPSAPEPEAVAEQVLEVAPEEAHSADA